MANDAQPAGPLDRVQKLIAVARDVVLFALLVLLLLFPKTLNGILTSAGFTRASIFGFEWEKQLEESARQTEAARRDVEALQGKLRTYTTEVEQIAERATAPEVKAAARSVAGDLRDSAAQAQRVGGNLAQTLQVQKEIQRNIAKKE